MGLFDNGREYRQEIFSDNLQAELKAVNDDYIQRWILTGLLNIRQKRPLDYKTELMDVDGFCHILGISKDQYLFNASLLKEDSLIQDGITRFMSIESGGMHITSQGVRYLSSVSSTPSIIEQNEHETDDFKDVRKEHQYDIAISFAGEDRAIAEKIAVALQDKNIRVFYDAFEQAELWGKNLYEHLSYVYNQAARFCIILISSHYAEKTWTNLERRSAQARAFREKNEYILPIRVDNTELPGLPETVGYISLDNVPIDKIVTLVIAKMKNLL